MLQKTRGIVLHSLKYNDASNIVDIYTESSGRLSFLVKVPKTKKAMVKPMLFQPLSIVEFDADFRPASRLHRISEAKPFLLFKSVPYNPYKASIAMFISEFLYRALKEETENRPLFAYLLYSVEWLDECETGFANFHLVFLMRLSRFLGLYPNVENYHTGDYFDLLNAGFTSRQPFHHLFVHPGEASHLVKLMRMNYETMHLFEMNRTSRNRCLSVINDYYRLHLPDFPILKSLAVLQEVFDA